MAFSKVVWLSCLFTTLAHATMPLDAFCVWGSITALYRVDFKNGVPYDYCGNELFIKSIYYSSAVYCTDGQIVSGLDYANETCLVEKTPLPDYESVVTTDADLSQVARVAQGESGVVDHPVIPDEDFQELGRSTVVSTEVSFGVIAHLLMFSKHAFYTNIWFAYDFS